MKKKSIFNKNEVDIDLLFNQPKHLRKMFGKKKDEDDENEVEDTEDDEDEETERKSVSPQMKKYIEDYIDSKKVKKKEKPKSALLDLSEKYEKAFTDYEDSLRENAKKHKGKGIIENFIKRKLNK
jgi:hypothetical protein